MSPVESIVIIATNVRRHPVRNRLIYDNLIEIEVDSYVYDYIRTGVEETRDIKEIEFNDIHLKITILDIKGDRYHFFVDPISYDGVKESMKNLVSNN